MDSITGRNVFSVEPLMLLMKEVIEEEENREILQTNLLPMDFLLHHISTVLQDQQAPEVLKLWLQLLHNCLTQAKNMLHRSNSRQRCLDCLSNNSERPSKQIRNWRLHFNYLFQGLEWEYILFVRGREAVIAPVIDPIIPLMKDVVEEEENRHILQTELRPLDNLLLDMSVVFQDQHKAAPEALKLRLQQLHNCLANAKSILPLYPPSQRQRRRMDCLSGDDGRSPRQVSKWKVLFNFLFQGLQEDFSMFVTSASHLNINEDPIQLELTNTEESTEESTDEVQESEISTDKAEAEISEVEATDESTEESTEESTDEVQESEISTDKAEAEISTDKLEAEISTDKAEAEISKVDATDESTEESTEESTDEVQESEISTDKVEAEISTDKADEAEESTLSKDEAWMLFRKIAFKDNPVPPDIEEYATNIADECKGLRLATILVAAAMRGKTRVDEWETSLSSIKNAFFSCPDTVHPELYKALRWCYDALPNSDVKNCFLYCAMYPKGKDINVQELVQMWIAEGFVRSKQQNHLMDMAIGRTCVNLLVDRCFFQRPADDDAIIMSWLAPEIQCIRVTPVVREMAKYIGEQEENCLLKAGQGLQNFPTIDNENCKRISVRGNHNRNLPAEFPCPKLVSLMLSVDDSIPPGFLVSLTSLRVLSLESSGINSIPSSVGQLKQLEFLSLRGLKSIQDLPEEMCHLSSLQFLDLEGCSRLQSLPSKIGDLKNLKYLSLKGCDRLQVIPHEISQLTSLSTLDAWGVEFSVEAESEGRRSIWRLKGLRNLTMLSIKVRSSSSGIIEEGIMGTWLDMRHLHLVFDYDDYDAMLDLPHDMENMRRLQHFGMGFYRGSSLPEYICKFQHLERIALVGCYQLRKLSPWERVPNLKHLCLGRCYGSEELEIGKSGGFLMLEKLILVGLKNLESIGRASDNDVWNESTLPRLRILYVRDCPELKRLPVGMDKLSNLTAIFGAEEWWQQIIWEDEAMETRLQSLYRKL